MYQLNEEQLASFEKAGFLVIDQFIDEVRIKRILAGMQELQKVGGFRPASIGKGQSEHVNTSQRGDAIHWIEPAEASQSLADYLGLCEEMRLALNRNFYLGLDYFECHYAEYPESSFYTRHTDRHRDGSTRMVSLVLYLNNDWKQGDGGELIIYEEHGDHLKIEPLGGRLALFLSEKEHEVLPTKKIRRSITGWMHHRPL